MSLDRYRLLATAVAGRSVTIGDAGGPRSFTDGEAIYVADLPEHLQRASVIAQAALLAIGSLEPAIMLRLAGGGPLRLRYLTVEANRAATALRQLLPRRVLELLGDLYESGPSTSPVESLAIAADFRAYVPDAPAWLGTIKPIKVLRNRIDDSATAPTERGPRRNQRSTMRCESSTTRRSPSAAGSSSCSRRRSAIRWRR